MPNAYGAPEIDVRSVSKKLRDNENFILMDVRELHELSRAKLDFPQTTVLPLSQLARQQLNAIPEELADKNTEIIVMCHHGVRSAQVTLWMLNNGWSNVLSLAGGIDAFARDIDPAIGFY